MAPDLHLRILSDRSCKRLVKHHTCRLHFHRIRSIDIGNRPLIIRAESDNDVSELLRSSHVNERRDTLNKDLFFDCVSFIELSNSVMHVINPNPVLPTIELCTQFLAQYFDSRYSQPLPSTNVFMKLNTSLFSLLVLINAKEIKDLTYVLMVATIILKSKQLYKCCVS